MSVVINDLVNPIFEYVNDFNNEQQNINYEIYKPKMTGLIENFATNAKEKGIAEDVIRDIKYGLTAFIDEMVLTSRWDGKDSWCEETLQIKFFGDHLAGERFFEKLSNARMKGEEFLPVLTVYYACLELGFSGIYRIRNKEYLVTLKRELKEQIFKYINTGLVGKLHLNKENNLMSYRKASGLFDPVFWFIGMGIVCFATFVGYKQAMDKYETKIINNSTIISKGEK